MAAPREVGPDSIKVTCDQCGTDMMTRVEHKPTTKTHLIAALLCIFCCWPCVCVPYCVDSCQSSIHHCSNCSAYIGAYNQ